LSVAAQFIQSAVQAIDALVRQAMANYVRRRNARRIYRGLCQLGDATLRDIGLDRSEIEWAAVETSKRAGRISARDLRSVPRRANGVGRLQLVAWRGPAHDRLSEPDLERRTVALICDDRE
jgi:uncharacterized protein YjiS (DUF1127 family)